MKKIFLALFVLLLLMQLYPRAKKNLELSKTNHDITAAHIVPDSVEAVLKTSCYDCHSNNTYYPWYSNLQPVNWWLNDHIEEGKSELNFSEFAQYRIGRQYRKLEEISKQIEEDEMPLKSYTIIHRNTILSEAQKKTVTNWTNLLRDSIKNNYPADSLKRKKR